MKNVVMGTAGHIDHGKTTLVKKLTGIDTDRLDEEKRRGMTIELGFAPLQLPSGNVISIVDVPGHEKFIKTMVAGVSGIDFVMLVIAADEGVMAQTKEHIDILSLLDVKFGVVVLTKVDLVDNEWITLVKEEVKKELKGTVFEKFDILSVSSTTGEGIEKLLKKLDSLSDISAQKKPQPFFRMPIDRVFTIQGHGTVITGTSLGGTIEKGETINFLPNKKIAKVRGIQVHNESSQYANSGQRCALNISGIEKSEIERGDVVTNEVWIEPIKLADAVLYTIKGNFNIINNQRLHVNIGTKEVLARITLIGTEKIASGNKGYVQLRFEEPVAALRGDRFIIRAFSPVITLGGGRILSHISPKRGRFKEETIEELRILEIGKMKDLVKQIIKKAVVPLSVEEVWHIVLGEKNQLLKTIEEISDDKEILILEVTKKIISKHLLEVYLKKINIEFSELYRKYPFRFEISKDELKSKIFNDIDMKDFTDILNHIVKTKLVLIENNKIRICKDNAFDRIKNMKEIKLVEGTIFQCGLSLKNKNQIKKEVANNASKLLLDNYDDIEEFLLRSEKIIALDNELLIHNDILMEIVNKIRELFKGEEFVTVAELRDYLGCSRKTIISVLEYLDTLGVTQRENDLRKPGVHYMDFFI